MTDAERHQLMISNALSTVAVADHEIIAVVANPSSENLHVITCIQHSNDENPLITPSQSSSDGSLGLLRFLVTKNHRRGDQKPQTIEPTITDSKIPPNLDGDCDTEVGLSRYLEKRW
jgi:hypothetical protein